ncbi:Aminoacyl-tRNA synthetase, class II (D/K/N),Nucleic acid-binding, OB-fold,Aspartyl/Asparaginyl- [Cinara cedri]|uniref:Aminoacyl-tRNA synthetase, class II (D/K/N),Nucleic acid-binding, OB-fold,Aspartyl/Asparaginyl n=1 Tax=Cinara cedri TaxID=506608 RepID=A0A5E4M2G6_9HEMI|nr:Aminoacyl-tRNA synthetase, class II (D/K/N),Nucleic acid-binding, OB-fold,Aspartyl/Asparaginyl- [Cinara cedri]
MLCTQHLIGSKTSFLLQKTVFRKFIINYSRILLSMDHTKTIFVKRYKSTVKKSIENIHILKEHKLNSSELHEFSNTNLYTSRTHTCGQLRAENSEEFVVLCGWLEYKRLNRFIILRDGYGSTQLIIPENAIELFNIVKDIPLESVITCYGKVKLRPANKINNNQATGMIEVIVDKLLLLNSVDTKIPFQIRKFHKANESLRLKYRYVDLRYPEMQYNLRLRSKLLMKMREFLINNRDFVEVETPTLFKKTPSGAQEFIVPTQEKGKCYSLIQSPQQLKQMLMVGSIDRYFQVAKCYRDEGSRPDRQPEFTQLDIEMSFTDQSGVMLLVEELLSFTWPSELGKIKTPFPQLSYEEAMLTYGSDKPDIGCSFKISSWTKFIRNSPTDVFALVIKNPVNKLTIKQLNELKKSIFTNYPGVNFSLFNIKSLDTFKENLQSTIQGIDVAAVVTAENISEHDLVAIASGSKYKALTVLGKINENFKVANNSNEPWRFVWVVDFPLFEMESGKIQSVHHPFTLPQTKVNSNNLLDVKGYHYDLVLNGCEVGGGSIRIHDASLQKEIIESILKIPIESMSHLVEALKSGCPPHGGIALGIDRFLSILCKTNSIRDVIAFPKTFEGKDLLTGAPSEITVEDMKRYHLNLCNTENS